jgi:3-dehydroquinate synthetase
LADRVAAHLSAVGLPARIADIPGGGADAAHLVHLMGQDKKVRDGKLTFILVRGIGQAYVHRDVPHNQVTAFLTRVIAEGG